MSKSLEKAKARVERHIHTLTKAMDDLTQHLAQDMQEAIHQHDDARLQQLLNIPYVHVSLGGNQSKFGAMKQACDAQLEHIAAAPNPTPAPMLKCFLLLLKAVPSLVSTKNYTTHNNF